MAKLLKVTNFLRFGMALLSDIVGSISSQQLERLWFSDVPYGPHMVLLRKLSSGRLNETSVQIKSVRCCFTSEHKVIIHSSGHVRNTCLKQRNIIIKLLPQQYACK